MASFCGALFVAGRQKGIAATARARSPSDNGGLRSERDTGSLDRRMAVFTPSDTAQVNLIIRRRRVLWLNGRISMNALL